jgi:hypothetical protein
MCLILPSRVTALRESISADEARAILALYEEMNSMVDSA